MFDSPPPAFTAPTNTNGKNNKKDDRSFSFCATLLAPPNSRGFSGFSCGFSYSSVVRGGTGSISGDKVANEEKEDASSATDDDFYFGPLAATALAVIDYAVSATAASRFSFRNDAS